MNTKILPKIVVVLGPTASGKTAFGLRLAKEFNGEIISADSRQMYKKLDIGSGKPMGEWVGGVYVVEGVPHYIMDCFEPNETVTVADFKNLALQKIADICKRGKLPIVVGGTGLYVQALVENLEIPTVLPQPLIRERLAKMTLAEKVAELKKIDPESFKIIDIKNARRVDRALEVALVTGESFVEARKMGAPLVEALQIGIHWDAEELQSRINTRLYDQFAAGFVKETKTLIDDGYSLEAPSLSSIGYKEIAAYLAGECTLSEAQKKVATAVWHYARRQLTWFKRDKRIYWLKPDDFEQARKLVEEFVN